MKVSLTATRLFRRRPTLARTPPSPRLLVEELEPRVLFSADAEAVLPGVSWQADPAATQQVETAALGPHPVQGSSTARTSDAHTEAPRHEVAFIDAGIAEGDSLIALLQQQAQADGRVLDIVRLDANADGLQQISDWLAQHSELDAVHVFSHGQAGALQLGSSVLDGDTLAARAGELVQWSQAFSAEGDLLLYGCDLAANAEGRQLLSDLALLTGADVAASDDLTGAAARGGDWVLEQQVGQIETAVALGAPLQAQWQGVLTTVTFQQGVNGYTGAVDTYLAAADFSGNGSSTTLQSGRNGFGDPTQTLIRFENIIGNGVGQIPQGSIITSVTLSFYAQSGSGSQDIYRMTETWSDNATYTGMGDGAFGEALLTSDGTLPGTGGNNVYRSVTDSTTGDGLVASVQAWANDPSTNHGWYTANPTYGAVTTYSSSETGNGPRLSVTYITPTPPTLDLDANDSSGATGNDHQGSFTEGGSAAPIADMADATITVGAATDMTGMTVTLNNRPNGAAESLSANVGGTSITASYNSGTGVLTLSGTASAAQYQQVLRTLTYSNSSDNPDTTARSLSFVLTDTYGQTASATSTIGVTAVNDAPVISSNGGGTNAAINVAEGSTAVTTVTATDVDGPSLTYSISGGADAGRFTIDSSTGALTFSSAPDRENPADADADNVYDVIVMVSDGSLSDTQTLAVTVTDLNDTAPVITSDGGGASAALNVAEGSTAVTTMTATDLDTTGTLTYSISGGADAGRFTIDSTTGALSFVTAPDREAPTDANADNVYDVIVSVSDGVQADTQTLAVTVTDLNDNTPVITSNSGGASAALNVAEGGTAVTTVTATDADSTSTLTYSISGGADAARFTIDPSTGALAFNTAPDFEAPSDADTDNVYDVIVTVSDGTHTDTQTLAVTVTDANDLAPVITSDGGAAGASLNVAEGSTAVTTVTATDADTTGTLTYGISGGADAARFTIDPITGALSFNTAPDFEAPTDANADNVYDVIVSVSDGVQTDVQTLNITVTDLNDAAPVITSNGGGTSAAINVAEGSTAVTTVTATDADGPNLSYGISGGADAGRFTIDSTTGALSFVTAPDRETPLDADADNVYDLIVTVSDGTQTDTQTLSITVTDVNDNAPAISSNGGGVSALINVAEGNTAVTTVTATDADSTSTLTYSISGGADAARFTIDPITGALTFNTSPDHEAPADADNDNVYDVIVTVSDGTHTDTQTLSVTVTDVNDHTPVITSNGGGASASLNVAEGNTAVTTVTATDADSSSTLTYGIGGGADAARFTINPITGALTFTTSPDHEAASDTDTDNVYDLIVTVSDGSQTDTQALSITVTNVNEMPDWSGATPGYTTPAGTPLVVGMDSGLMGNAQDPDGDSLQVMLLSGPSRGSLILAGDGSFSYQPDAGFAGVDRFTVALSDGGLQGSSRVIELRVEAPPSVPEGGAATPILCRHRRRPPHRRRRSIPRPRRRPHPPRPPPPKPPRLPARHRRPWSMASVCWTPLLPGGAPWRRVPGRRACTRPSAPPRPRPPMTPSPLA